jgi:hypothetical protein
MEDYKVNKVINDRYTQHKDKYQMHCAVTKANLKLLYWNFFVLFNSVKRENYKNDEQISSVHELVWDSQK